MKGKYVAAFDSGTTSCRTILFDHAGDVISSSSQEFPQIYPKPGWVEHNPLSILEAQLATAKQALNQAKASPLELSRRSVSRIKGRRR